jgi:hypothetical protein
MGSSIAGTAQQMSTSFGVAVASLLTVLFVGTRTPGDARMILGLHQTFLDPGAADDGLVAGLPAAQARGRKRRQSPRSSCVLTGCYKIYQVKP